MKGEIEKVQNKYSEVCPVLHALEIIGGKWRVPIIWEISVSKSIRYNELKARIPGITNIMLTRSLQVLEEHRLIKRTEYNKIPPHVEYSLTDDCNDLLPELAIINELGKRVWPEYEAKNETK